MMKKNNINFFVIAMMLKWERKKIAFLAYKLQDEVSNESKTPVEKASNGKNSLKRRRDSPIAVIKPQNKKSI